MCKWLGSDWLIIITYRLGSAHYRGGSLYPYFISVWCSGTNCEIISEIFPIIIYIGYNIDLFGKDYIVHKTFTSSLHYAKVAEIHQKNLFGGKCVYNYKLK